MENVEIEYKYRAKVTVPAFKNFCETLIGYSVKKYTCISGWDHFYSSADPNSFYRHRTNVLENQLTFKAKLSESIAVRVEQNISLSLDTSDGAIKDFCERLNFKYNTSVFKSCFIYDYAYFTLVYYVCYDEDMKEIGRFIEVEADSSKIDNAADGQTTLKAIEQECKSIGLNPSRRVNMSLFDMFRKDV